jgi:hypothetical protein
MLSDFDRARKAEKDAARDAADAPADTDDASEGDQGQDSTGQGEEPEQVVRSTNPSSRRDPAGENSPLGESAGASGMAPQSTDQPDIERERFRDRT